MGDYFGVVKQENTKTVIMVFAGGGYKVINEYWDAPYSDTQLEPRFGDYPVMVAIFGDKHIITQNDGVNIDDTIGIVVKGADKVGDVSMRRLIGGEYKGELAYINPVPEKDVHASIYVSCGDANTEKRFKRIKVKGIASTDFAIGSRVEWDNVTVPALLYAAGGTSYGLNMVSKKPRFDIYPRHITEFATRDLRIDQISLTFDSIMPEIKK
jgi:hypothetical protein